MAKLLPIFRNWTVDFKLQEFRRVVVCSDGSRKLYQYSFRSDFGDYLLGEMITENKVPFNMLTI